MSPGGQWKSCPVCKAAASIDAPQCFSCGHVYRTNFSAPQPTQVITAPWASQTPKWLWPLFAVCCIGFALLLGLGIVRKTRPTQGKPELLAKWAQGEYLHGTIKNISDKPVEFRAVFSYTPIFEKGGFESEGSAQELSVQFGAQAFTDPLTHDSSDHFAYLAPGQITQCFIRLPRKQPFPPNVEFFDRNGRIIERIDEPSNY